MKTSYPIVLQLQNEAASNEVDTTTLLRKAKLIAEKLDQKDAIEWINLELNGYEGLADNKIPPYRHIEGMPHYYNPYHGWFPISFKTADDKKCFSHVRIDWPISAVEDAIIQNNKGIDIPAYELTQSLKQNYVIRLNSTTIKTIVDKVRNLILDWSLELEKAGILGDQIIFTPHEKEEAKKVTNNYNFGNIGVLGDIDGHAKVENHQSLSINLDVGKVKNFAIQSLNSLDGIDDEQVREKLKYALETLKQETEATQTDASKSKMQSTLQSIKRISETAVGNIISQGIARVADQFIKLF